MTREAKATGIVDTADGSHTLQSNRFGECYHSKNGALNEAIHVFINAGLKHYLDERPCARVRILEVGFGTGLNALLTRIHSESENVQVHYSTCEAFPVETKIVSELNYAQHLKVKPAFFMDMHLCEWEMDVGLSAQFTLHKMKVRLEDLDLENGSIDIIYFDAFSPDTQPELWTIDVFKKLHSLCSHNGMLVTYSAKGDVKRALKSAGFTVKRLDGPVGKWHMLRAHRA